MNGGAAASSWADERDLRPGHVIGPFELIGLVGRGGMARVWAARDTRSGSLFAVKMLRAHLAENEEFRKMFFDEARIAMRIQHENVARTFELCELDGILTLVMELVDGPSLVRIIRPGFAEREDAKRVALPPRVAARIVAEACAGLHAAHELRDEAGRLLNVVHRDVSPHNVLVTGDGRVKLTDFGIAKAIGKTHQTLAGTIKGKPAYMSPEQLAGGGLDRRSDVFALGCVLYELSVGVRAFDGETDPEIMRAILAGDPTPPSRIALDYPAVLEQIIMTALAPTADGRWPTARHMQDALEAYLAGSGPLVGAQDVAALLNERIGPPPSSEPLRRPAPPALPSREMQSGTRRRSVENHTSWTLVLVAMVVGLGLGLLVLRSVYIARKANASAAALPAPRPKPPPSASENAATGPAGPTGPTPTSSTTATAEQPASAAAAPPNAPPNATPNTSPSASPRPVAAPAPAVPRPIKSSAPALPPNPYD
ncbi:MAG: serine/threonine protein kinase [Labilithrix sp.]|nr:serine/threonine protein kinase [Labilithrix sp.]MCW5815051.1 serine/threonine protein kinase [Labilithrix sp.]